MNTFNDTDAKRLFERLLSHRDKATAALVGHSDNLVAAEHNGLTINYHDSKCLEPGCDGDCSPPLSITVWDDAANENVFMGDVDPEDVAFNQVAEWKRGPWEALLGQAH